MKFIAWISIIAAAVVALGGTLYFYGPQSLQQELRDTKADIVGTHRIAYIINPFTNGEIRAYEDDNMRFVRREDGSRTVWLGEANRKIDINHIPIVIIEDQP